VVTPEVIDRHTHPEDAPAVRHVVRASLEEGKAFALEHRNVPHDPDEPGGPSLSVAENPPRHLHVADSAVRMDDQHGDEPRW